MKPKKINSIVSYYEKPALGTIKGTRPIMALTVDKSSKKPYLGIARVIKKRKGNPDVPGFLDKSKLIIIKSTDRLNWKKEKDLEIKDIKELIKKITPKDFYFIGLEDPDITNINKTKHLYFTIAFRNKKDREPMHKTFLGHAQGKNLDNLTATKPVLSPRNKICGFKEICFSPLKKNKIHLTESLIDNKKINSSVISAVREDKNKFKHLKFVFNPIKSKSKSNWCQGYTSPCRILPKSFINFKGYHIGIINGREKDKIVNKKTIYGSFRPGLILFNSKTGDIPWISPNQLFEDPDSTGITFASDFIQITKNRGILYCHVNDSFIRAYEINARELKKLLPKKT